MMRTLAKLRFLVLAGLGFSGCADSFGQLGPNEHLEIEILDGDRGSLQQRLPISFDTPVAYTIRVTAKRGDGLVDGAFNGFVRLSAKPGNIAGLTGTGTEGRNVQLAAGVSNDIRVTLLGAHGDTRIWAEDVGYVPADPARVPPPQCADGIDNDGDSIVDFPADPGCAFANDDSETGGTYALGSSETIFIKKPRISDVRGEIYGGVRTPFPHAQVEIDTGWDGTKFNFSVVVTRRASDGIYLTELNDNGTSRDYGSVFAYTYSAPPGIAVCDRLRSFAGTPVDFFGFTEIGFPTWSVEPWVPDVEHEKQNPCRVPDAIQLVPGLTDLFKVESSLVAADALDLRDNDGNLQQYRPFIAKHFGPAKPPGWNATPPDYTATDDASNCDIDGNGQIDFENVKEADCSRICTADLECSEYTSFLSRSNFLLVFKKLDPSAPPDDPDRNATAASFRVQGNGAQVGGFDPLPYRGKRIRMFRGTLRYFSGGSSFTVEARCGDDIVVDPNQTPLGVRPSIVKDANGKETLVSGACMRPPTDPDREGSQ